MGYGLPTPTAEDLVKRADLYRRLASVARNKETSHRLARLADRFAGEAARIA